MTAMSTSLGSERPASVEIRPGRGPQVDRIVLGLLVAAIGVGWLLDQAGVSVPWRMLPAAALVLIGLALMATLLGEARAWTRPERPSQLFDQMVAWFRGQEILLHGVNHPGFARRRPRRIWIGSTIGATTNTAAT